MGLVGLLQFTSTQKLQYADNVRRLLLCKCEGARVVQDMGDWVGVVVVTLPSVLPCHVV